MSADGTGHASSLLPPGGRVAWLSASGTPSSAAPHHGGAYKLPAVAGSGGGAQAAGAAMALPSDELFNTIKRQLASLQASFAQAGAQHGGGAAGAGGSGGGGGP